MYKISHGTDLNMLMIFWHKIKSDNFDSYNVLLAISTNILQILMTGFVLQGQNNLKVNIADLLMAVL